MYIVAFVIFKYIDPVSVAHICIILLFYLALSIRCTLCRPSLGAARSARCIRAAAPVPYLYCTVTHPALLGFGQCTIRALTHPYRFITLWLANFYHTAPLHIQLYLVWLVAPMYHAGLCIPLVLLSFGLRLHFTIPRRCTFSFISCGVWLHCNIPYHCTPRLLTPGRHIDRVIAVWSRGPVRLCTTLLAEL